MSKRAGVVLLSLLFAFSSSQLCEVTNSLTVRPQPDAPAGTSTLLNSFFQSLNSTNNTLTTCTDVTIEGGRYHLSRSFLIRNLGRLKLDGIGSVILVLSNSRDNETINDFALGIQNVDYTEISGIDFDGSLGLLAFNNIRNLVIQNSRFRSFQEGTLNILNCANISIFDSRFNRNGMVDVIRRRLTGGSGGLSIQYTKEFNFTEQLNFHIRNVNFTRNSAMTASSQSFTEVTSGDEYTGRGGAIFLFMENEMAVSGIIESCRFIRNYADLYGGAVYIAFNALSQNNITIKDCLFRRNSAIQAGGALMVTYQEGGDDDYINRVEMSNCWIDVNTAEYGGGVYFFVSITEGREDGELGTFMSFDTCWFTRNSVNSYGSAIGATALNLFESKGETLPAEITNCTFTTNTGITVGITNFPFIFSGHNNISDNDGPGLLVVGARVTFDGRIDFNDNDVTVSSTGVLLLLSGGQIELAKGTVVNFYRNRGGQGAGIVPTIAFSPSTYNRLLYNPLCSFLYQNRYVPPDQWEVSMNFDENRATVGSAVYTNKLDFCSWTGQTNNTFDVHSAYRWNFITFGRRNRNKAYPRNEPSHLFDVQTQPISINTPRRVEGFPGQQLQLQIFSYDEINRLTYAVWRFQAIGEFSRVIQFNPNAVTANNDLNKEIGLSFYVNFPPDLRNVATELYQKPITISVTTLLNEEERETQFDLIVKRCPPGFILSGLSSAISTDYRQCLCNEGRFGIDSCNDSVIYLAYNLWGTESNVEEDRLFLGVCPFGYCQCDLVDFDGYLYCLYTYERGNPDSVCSCDRRGILCGECINATSVSALLNQCTSCSDANAILIVLLIIWVFACFIFIMLLRKPFPDWFQPSMFYLQLLPLLVIHFPTKFEIISPYLYYIVNFLSFYFPYDFCLYSNTSTLASYTLKFIPAIIGMIVIPSVMFIKDYVLRAKIKRLPHHGVYDIILVLYTPTLYAAGSIANCYEVPISSNASEWRWYHDGTVKCYEGGHLSLFLLALVVLILCIGIIPVLLLVSASERKIWRFCHYAALSITQYYKEKFWYWGPLELIKRLVLLVCIILAPSDIIYIYAAIVLSFGIHMIFQPYRSKVANATDAVIGSIVFILLTSAIVEYYIDELGYIIITGNVTAGASKCDISDNIQLNPFATVIGTIYYLPVLVVLIISTIYHSKQIYDYAKNYRLERKKKIENQRIEVALSRVKSMRTDVVEQRQRSNTTNVFVVRRDSDVPVSPNTLEASEEIGWKSRSFTFQEKFIKE